MCPASVGTSRARVLESGEAKLWALLVGVNHYEDEQIPDLSYSALDCQGLGEAIAIATQAFPGRSVVMHHDLGGSGGERGDRGDRGDRGGREGGGRSLVEDVAIARRMGLTAVAKMRNFPVRVARLGEVRQSLEQIAREAKPQDTVLFYFSGHGFLEEVTRQAVLCVTDTRKDALLETGLSLEGILSLLGDCAAQQKIVWLDACHSGGMTLQGTSASGLVNVTPQLLDGLQKRVAQGFYALLSCDRNQQSWEFPELGHGVFTYYLMRGLLGEAADAQGVIEADALYKYVYYQTLRYIDKTNQQLRLINQQKRGRGDDQLQSEYPMQTPKRIVEGMGELILGMRSQLTTPRYPRQALLIDGSLTNSTTLEFGKILRGKGGFELEIFSQSGKDSGKDWHQVKAAIQTCLQTDKTSIHRDADTVLLYLRGKVLETGDGEAKFVFKDGVEVSRSWLRQELRKLTSRVGSSSRQIIILDCLPVGDMRRDGNAELSYLADWIEDLQVSADRGQCLIAATSSSTDSEQFSRVLIETLEEADQQTGLSIAGWISQLQMRLVGTGIAPQIYLSGSQGVIEVVPGRMGSRGSQEPINLDLGICPYMGLKAFSEEDAPFFFGREGLTQQLINHLRQHSFLAVVGASGSGKSSVVRAGLLSELRQGKQIPGSEQWRSHTICPGEHPLEALLQDIAESIEPEQRQTQILQLEGMFYQGVEGFVHWLRSHPAPMIVLFIDQFEELFTLATEKDRQQFLNLILGGLEYAGDRFKVIITLRSDFISPGLEYPALAQALQSASVLVPPVLQEESYRQIIVRPAEKVGLSVEPELVEVLLQELSHEAGDLPLLEFVLEQLWEQRQPGALTLKVYQQKMGGLKRALEQKAQQVYDQLDVEEKACARWIFLSLTQLGDSADTRRRITKSDLVVKKYPEALVDRTLKALTDAKLVLITADMDTMVTSPSPPSDLMAVEETSPTIEVIHEILIRHWSTLRWWLDENRTRLRTLRQIEQSTTQWRLGDQQSDFVLRGVRLDAAEELYIKYTDELSGDVQRFIEAGLEQRDREKNIDQRRLKQARRAIALISILGISATGFGGFAFLQRQRSTVNEIAALNALSESQLLANQQLEAITTSLRAGERLKQFSGWGIDGATQTSLQQQTIATLEQAIDQTVEQNRLEGHSQSVTQVLTSPNGQWIASASDDGTVRLWQLDGQLVRVINFGDRVTSITFTANSDLLLAANEQGIISFVKVADGTVQHRFKAGTFINSIALSPDGKWLATASRDPRQRDGLGDTTIKLWDAATNTLIHTLTGHKSWINQVSFSPNSQQLVSAGEDKAVRLWNVAQGTMLNLLEGHTDRVTSAVFSPDAKRIVSGSGDRTLRIWNLETGAMETREGHTDQVNSVQFTPDGSAILSASQDQTLRIWSVENSAIMHVIKGHGAGVRSADFSRDRLIVSGSEDKTVRLWRLPKMQQTEMAWGTSQSDGKAERTIYSISFNPDQTRVATIEDQTVKLWRGQTNTLTDLITTPLSGLKGQVPPTAIALSSTQLAATSDTQINLWSIPESKLVRALIGHQAPINSLAFSPTQPLLASGSEDKTIRLWQTETGQLLQTLSGHENGVTAVIFSPNGRAIASGSHDNRIKLWTMNGQLIQTLTGHKLAISALTYSPNGQLLASGSYDNTVKIWRDGALLHTLNGHQDSVTAIAFNPDGTILVSAGDDRRIRLWNVETGELIKTMLGNDVGYPGGEKILAIAFTKNDQGLIVAGEKTSVTTLVLNWNELEQKGCDRLLDYFRGQSEHLCSDRDYPD